MTLVHKILQFGENTKQNALIEARQGYVNATKMYLTFLT